MPKSNNSTQQFSQMLETIMFTFDSHNSFIQEGGCTNPDEELVYCHQTIICIFGQLCQN